MQQRWWWGLTDKKEDDETGAIVLGASLSQNSHNSFPCYCILTMTNSTIGGEFLQQQESPFLSRKFFFWGFFEFFFVLFFLLFFFFVFFSFSFFFSGGYLVFCFLGVLGVGFFLFKLLFLCVPYQFEIPLILIVLAFTLEKASQGMSRMFTLLLASFPKRARSFYLCKHSPLMCFSLVLFLLLLGVGFGLNLTPFWGYLSLGLCAFIYFIGSLKPSKTIKQPFHLPLDQIVHDPTNELAWFFSSYYPIGVCVLLEEVI